MIDVGIADNVDIPSMRQTSSSSPFVLPSSPSYVVQKRSHRIGSRRQSHYGDISESFTAYPVPNSTPTRTTQRRLGQGHAPPVIQGIQLIPLTVLPDRMRSIFPFELFNAVQSKCFGAVHKSDDNVVISAPTSSGKTAVLEMAICRLMERFQAAQYRVVYLAPTKSLCSERFKDWQPKFAPFGLQCIELTGDSDITQMRNMAAASIIITTPEKWDSITRKWKDRHELIDMVKLFLIDEVHILKEARGATLEAVVSRMKSVGPNVRFIALSATVPNSGDIAVWLGRNGIDRHLPAHEERFNEDFRPVKLQKHVHGFHSSGNDFAFDKLCDSK